MADFLSKAKRSQVMAAIRSSGNQGTELKLMAVFRTHGITGWRRNQRVFGKPDFVFRKQKVAVFVDGCFWHGCRWHCRMPNNNKKYWRGKISRNVERDRLTTRALRRNGWAVVRVWEHSLRSPETVAKRIKSLLLDFAE